MSNEILVIGKRDKLLPLKYNETINMSIIFWTLIGCGIFILFIGIIAESIATFGSIGGIFIISGFICILYRKTKRQSNINNNKSIFDVLEFSYNYLVIYSYKGKKKVYTDTIKDIKSIGNKIFFTLEKSNKKRYKVIAAPLENAIEVENEIVTYCNELVPSSRRPNIPFIYNDETIYPVGDCAGATSKAVLIVVMISCAIVMIAGCISTAIYELWGTLIFIFILFSLVIIFVGLIYKFLRVIDRKDLPAIGITKDGVFILIHNFDKFEYINDKIIDITHIFHVSTNISNVTTYNYNNTVATTTTTITRRQETYGAIVFKCEDNDKVVNQKVVRHVASCAGVASYIRNLLSL